VTVPQFYNSTLRIQLLQHIPLHAFAKCWVTCKTVWLLHLSNLVVGKN